MLSRDVALLGLMAVSLVCGCSPPLLPDKYVLVPNYGPTGVVPLDEHGASNWEVAKVLAQECKAISVRVSASDPPSGVPVGEGSPGAVVAEAHLPSGLTIEAVPDRSLEIESRVLVSASGGITGSYYGLSAEVDAKHNLEAMLSLSKEDPRFRVDYVVRPGDLLGIQRSSPSGTRTYVLFHRYMAAPRVVHGRWASAVAGGVRFFGLGVKADATYTEKFDLSHRMVLREYGAVSLASAVICSREPMFVEAPADRQLSFGKRVSPDALCFQFADKRYVLSSAYSAHLDAEHVYFDTSDPEIRHWRVTIAGIRVSPNGPNPFGGPHHVGVSATVSAGIDSLDFGALPRFQAVNHGGAPQTVAPAPAPVLATEPCAAFSVNVVTTMTAVAGGGPPAEHLTRVEIRQTGPFSSSLPLPNNHGSVEVTFKIEAVTCAEANCSAFLASLPALNGSALEAYTAMQNAIEAIRGKQGLPHLNSQAHCAHVERVLGLLDQAMREAGAADDHGKVDQSALNAANAKLRAARNILARQRALASGR